MLYKLIINIKKNYNFENLNILDFFLKLKKSFNVLNKEYVFFDNSINFNTYDPKKLNCFIEYVIKTEDKNIFNSINNFLKNYDFIEEYIFSKLNHTEQIKESFEIDSSQITSLVNKIDKLFYIRKELQEMGKFIKDDKKDSYYKLIKNLSLTKYELKNETFNLRLIDIEYDINAIQNSLVEFAKNLGIDLQFTFDTHKNRIDKIVYFNIKPSLVALLYSFVSEEYKRQQKNIQKESFKLHLEFLQEFNKLKILILNKNVKRNPSYASILKNDYFSYNDNENEINFFNYKTSISTHNGRTYIDESNNIISKIHLNFLSLDCYIIQSELGYFAIDKSQIVKIYNYEPCKNILIENKEYYILNDFKLPIINKMKNPKYAIHIYTKKQNFIFLIDNILYEEKIFVQPIKFDNTHFIGECLLKDTKKAYILNLATYL